MRILYLAHRIPYPPNKGEKIRAYHQVKYLAGLHVLDLICLIDDQRDLPHVATLEQLCNRTYAHLIKPLPSKVKGLLTQLAGGSVSVGYYHRAAVQKVVDRWLAESAYDVIICFSSTMAEYVFRTPVLERQPLPRLIMDFCDVDSDKWRQYAETARLPLASIYGREHRRMQQYEQKVHHAFDFSILVSRQEADLFADQVGTGKKITVIQNGIDAAFFDRRQVFIRNRSQSSVGPIIVFTGAMNYHVNVDGVLWFCSEVLPLIRQAHPQVSFKIVGSNPTTAVKQLAKQEGVEVTGFVEDIRPYYAMADVCVAPLRLGRGIQNKVLEAMAMERAVVTTSRANAGIQAVCGKHLLVADEPDAFAVAVSGLLKNEISRAQLGRVARHFVVDHFNWQKKMAEFAELLPPEISDETVKTSRPPLSSGAYEK